MLRMLALKRAERERETEKRQAELAAQAAVIQAEYEARQQIEIARIERDKAVERAEREAYKEYCAVGAKRRLEALSFKFKIEAPAEEA